MGEYLKQVIYYDNLFRTNNSKTFKTYKLGNPINFVLFLIIQKKFTMNFLRHKLNNKSTENTFITVKFFILFRKKVYRI